MNNTTSPQFALPPLIAGATIPPLVLIKAGTSADQCVKATANAKIIGAVGSGTKIVQGLPGYDATVKFEAGDPVTAAGPGSVCLVTAGGAITVNADVEANSSGYAVNSSSAGQHNLAGIALDAAASSGEIIRVWLRPQQVTI